MSDPVYISSGDQIAQRIINPLSHIIPTLGCRVRNSANISIPDLTITALTFDTEDWKNGGNLHSTSTNTSRITFPFAGVWTVMGMAYFTASAAGTIRIGWIRLNGSNSTMLTRGDGVISANTQAVLTLATSYRFAAADYIELVVRQDTGGALNILGDGISPWLSAQWFSP